jgi:ribosomal protein L37E
MKPSTSHGKLTPAAVRLVRRLHEERRRTGKRVKPLHKDLCARWGVSHSMLKDITRGRTYRWVQP